MPTIARHFTAGLLPIPLLALLFCDRPVAIPDLAYSPPVVFAGIINGEYHSLPGNRSWPNTCALKGDTLRMRFFSKPFTEKSVRSGDFLRIDILPDSGMPAAYETRGIIFHMARYRDVNYSYEVTPHDTLWTGNVIYMRRAALALEHGGPVSFDKISVTAKAMTGSEELTIKEGRISGTVE